MTRAPRYDVVETPLGPLAVTVRGGRVSAARWGRRPAGAARRARLPRVRRWVAALLKGRRAAAPLDFGEATPFVRRVYRAARRIPPGRTRTYGDLARAAGRPGAARAVGQAMARNPLCLFVP